MAGIGTKALKLGFVLSATDKMSRVVNDAVNQSTSRLTAFERNASKIGGSLMKGGGLLAGAGAAVLAGTYKLAQGTANYGNEVMKTSQKVGIQVEQWQKLAYAANYADVETNDLQKGMQKLVKQMNAAAGGSKSAQQLFKDLGIEIKDQSGNLRAPNEIFEELAGTFSSVKDGSAKTALAMELFGNSGTKLIPMLNMGQEAIAELGLEAEATGNILSEDACRASEEFNDNLQRLKHGLQGAGLQIGAAFMPMVLELGQKVTSVVQRVAGWIKENPKLVGTIAKVTLTIGGLLAVFGTGTMVVGGVISIAGKCITMFRGLMKAVSVATKVIKLFNVALLSNPIVLIIAAVVALATSVYLIVKHWDKVKAFFSKLWEGVKNIFRKAWDIIKAIVLFPIEVIKKAWGAIAGFFSGLWNGIKGVAGKVWGGIKNICSKAKEGVQKAWGATKGFFSKLWGGIKADAGKKWDGIKSVCSKAKDGAQKAWAGTTGFFSDLWGKIRTDSENKWSGIKSMFTNLKPVEWIMGAWDSVGEFFSNLGRRFFEWGKNLISSLWSGIKSIENKAVEGVKGVARKIAGGFKSFFGINSPSKLMMGYGINITEGLVEGIHDGEKSAESATGSLAMNTMRGMEVPAGTTDNSTTTNSVGGTSITYAPVVTINGKTGPETEQNFRRILMDHAKVIEEILDRRERERQRLSFV
ncbi:MAG: phage tail tape measure protein [Alistipes sp.]|nr:phage tail tape measure protein [Alistipes sp.]